MIETEKKDNRIEKTRSTANLLYNKRLEEPFEDDSISEVEKKKNKKNKKFKKDE